MSFLPKVIIQLSQLAQQTPKSTKSIQANFHQEKLQSFTMKTFFVLIAVVAVASAKTINRVAGTGWGSPALKPSVNIDLVGAAAAAASGQASGNQALIETAFGDHDAPAYIQSLSGVLASVSQGEEVSQLAVADKPTGTTSTINVVEGENLAYSNDQLQGIVGGGFGAAVANSGQTQSSGEGAMAEEGSTMVVVEDGSHHHY